VGGVLENKSGNISETCKDSGKVTTETYRKSPTLFRTVPYPTLCGLPFPEIGGSQPHPKTAITIISGTAKATDSKFGRYIERVVRFRRGRKFVVLVVGGRAAS